ncbi:MAG: hypothetical protein M1835_000801 [Candelina submexicana]|nr:MAG: hypothetical protein M1835_000801 [Candelina submexicana]
MARGKNAGARDASRGSGRAGLNTSFLPTPSFVAGYGKNSAGALDGSGRPQFSLRDEARHTERHHSRTQSGLKLRHTKVTFVSGGDLRTEESKDDVEEPAPTSCLENALTVNPSGHSEPAFSETKRDDDVNVKQGVTTLEARFPRDESRSHGGPNAEGLGKRPANGESFIVDTIGSHPMETESPAPRIRSLSPTLSDSSEEIILYAGRKIDHSKVTDRKISYPACRPLSSPEMFSGSRRSCHTPTRLAAHRRQSHRLYGSQASSGACSFSESQTSGVDQHRGQFTPLRSNTDELTHEKGLSFNRSQVTASSASISGMRKARRERRRKHRRLEEENEDDAGLADYIANMPGSGDSEVDSSQHDEAINVGYSTVESPPDAKHSKGFSKSLAWNRSELCDFDDLSSSDEVLGTIQQILSKRERATGTQYLIVWEGYTVDDARWIRSSSLTMEGAAEKVLLFEDELKLLSRSFPKGDYEDSSTEEDDLEEELEDIEDVEDLVDRRLPSLTDEQIARLLYKQEELGMGSSELMLFNAMDDDDDGHSDKGLNNEEGFSFKNDFDMEDLLRSSRSSRRPTRRTARRFPSATLLADILDQDQYRVFDVMDYARPSLKKKTKDRRGALLFELSDSDLEVSLQAAGRNDRNTKKAKKKERQERRAQGLLGARNKGKPNMRVKYKQGVTMSEVVSEIKIFLNSEHQSLLLSPLDKRDRKTVHEIANAFKLRSKSVGQGQARSPVLYKTSRSGIYDDENALEMIEARLDRMRFLPRADKRRRKDQRAPKGTGGGGGSIAVSYMDGDVVGAAAPELSTENRGRAMLVKMGWSTGTALGALNNKGILQPVAHVVKTTKAGLG